MQAVVFDLDDTLAVPARDRATLLAEAADAAGAPAPSREAYLRVHRRHLADGGNETREPLFADLLAGRETAASPADLAAAYRRAVADALEPVAGVETLLADLREEYRVGLLTNGPTAAGRSKLRALGWTDRFDATVVTGEVGAGKPDGRAFAAVLDELGVPAAGAVHVGDQVEADVRGAREAGLRAVQVRYPGGPDPHPLADAHVARDDLADRLPAVVASLDGW